MNNIPKPIIVFVVFFLAIVFIVFSNPPYTKCQSQIEILRANLKSDIFAQQGKSMTFSPRLTKHIAICKDGNSPGACFELFQTLRSLTRELVHFPAECAEEMGDVVEVQRALKEGMALMTQLAWGESPPPAHQPRFRWLEPADLALFCSLRDNFVRLYGHEEFESFRTGVVKNLPGEEPMFSEGQCVNCEFRKKAHQVMSSQDLWKQSLFSAPCNLYR